MRRRWFWIAPLAVTGIVVFFFVGGELVMHLWNWLLPPLFGWHTLTFWQALAFLVLCRILFGRLGGPRGPRYDFRRRFGAGCRNTTPEDREKFRRAMTEGYGFASSSDERETS